MVKPFSLKELAARVFALLRRSLRTAEALQASSPIQESTQSEAAIITDHFFIEPDCRQVMVQRTPGAPVESIELTTLEFELLYTLARRPGRVWTRTQLLDEIRGMDYVGDDRTIDGAVKRLRPKISPPDDLTRFIKTHIRLGYSFEDNRP
jgi:two-component system OmpR family response regulator